MATGLRVIVSNDGVEPRGGAAGASLTAADGEAPWTPEALVARLGGDELLARQLARLFVEECPQMIAEVRDSVESGSADRIRRAAHAIKGSMSNFTAGAPTTTAFVLEAMGRDHEVGDAPAVFDQLTREVGELAARLDAFGRGMACAS